MNKKKLLARIRNSQKNVKYSDFVTLLNAFEFEYMRTSGSHNIYHNDNVPKNVNAQNKNGQAKSYQVQQFLFLVDKYDLKMKDNYEEETENV